MLKSFLVSIGLSLLFTGLAPAQQTAVKTISGTVTQFETGAPISEVEILVKPDRSFDDGISEAITDPAGHFVIRDIPLGRYTLTARKLGYGNPVVNGERVLEGGSTHTVTVDVTGNIENVKLTLVPAGEVYGRIFDAMGRPAVQYQVILESKNTGVGAKTDDRGEYRVLAPPGSFYLFAAPWLSSTPTTPVFYPGVTSKARATLIEVMAGSTLRVDMMAQTFATPITTVTGVFRNSDGSRNPRGLGGVHLIPRGVLRSSELERFAGLDPSGLTIQGDEFTVSFSANPGEYFLYLTMAQDDGLGVNRPVAVAQVPISMASTSANLKIGTVTISDVQVTGKLMVPSGYPLSPSTSVQLSLQPGGLGGLRSWKVRPDSTGLFAIPNVPDGDWKLEILDLPKNLALLDVQLSGTSIVDGGLVVRSQPPDPLSVMLSPAGAIRGSVQDGQGAGERADVILVPANLVGATTLYRTTPTDGRGAFVLSNVPVGAYRILAIKRDTRDPSLQEATTEVLRATAALYPDQATPVVVTPDASIQLLLVLGNRQ